MKRRILVIGATGLLGAPVANRLKKSGFGVRLMVRNLEKAVKRFGEGFEIVKGNILDPKGFESAAENCFGVHINLSGEIEQVGVETIAAAAAKLKLQRITYISGTSVAEANTWVPLIRRKFFAERAIRECGVPYCIFCPTWFMEVLPRYVRGNRALVFGKQPNPYHFVAADDYARMVASSYRIEEAVNRRFVVHGPEGILFHDAVKRYCQAFHPGIKKVSTMPHWLATLIASTKGPRELKSASDFMAAFGKIGEKGNPAEANDLLGAPQISLDGWLCGAGNKGLPMPAVGQETFRAAYP